jgi:hypothetical protein
MVTSRVRMLGLYRSSCCLLQNVAVLCVLFEGYYMQLNEG